MTMISEKQWFVIAQIYEYLCIEFHGTTKNEANTFITRYLEDSKKAQIEDEIMAGIQYDECGFLY